MLVLQQWLWGSVPPQGHGTELCPALSWGLYCCHSIPGCEYLWESIWKWVGEGNRARGQQRIGGVRIQAFVLPAANPVRQGSLPAETRRSPRGVMSLNPLMDLQGLIPLKK